jgi:hypothetical protein
VNIIQQGEYPQDDCKFTLDIAEKSLLLNKLKTLVYDSWEDNLKHRDMKILVWLLTDQHIFTSERIFYSQDTLTRIQELLN